MKSITVSHWKKMCASIILLIVMLAVSFLTCNGANAQVNQSPAWSKTYPGFGDLARTVIQTADGGYALLCTKFNFGDPNYASGVFYLLKVDSAGNQQWNGSYTGSIFDVNSGQYLVQTLDGGYAAVAEYQNKLILTKMDQSGTEQWNQTYAGAGACIPSAIIQTSDGGFALLSVSNYYTGHVYPPPSGYSETVWLVKTNSSGDLQWSKTYGPGDANSLIQTNDGGYAIAGQTLNPNSYYLLIKADSSGNQEWNKTYYHMDENFLCTVAQTNDNGYALGGWIWLRSNGGGPNMAITKTNSTGVEEWTDYYGSGSTFAMTKTNDAGFALAGKRLVKVDSTGNQQWTTDLSGQPNCVIQTLDGDYVLSGYSNINTSATGPWLTKIDPTTLNQIALPSTSPSPNPSQTQPTSSPSPKPSSPLASPTPIVPEFSCLAIFPLLLLILSLAVISRLRRKRD
jgi:hypothetical protein